MDEFIDETITVEREAFTTAPRAFVWRGVRYAVAEVLQAWQAWHTPPYAKYAKKWMHRRHRNYFIVRTTDDQVFELYLDRAFGRREWVLYKRRTQT